MTSDCELLRSYAEDSSEEAFRELVRRHVDFVYASALRQTRNPQRAEDVTQSVFTDLARKASRLWKRDELLGWLHTSTHYASTDLVRSEARRQAREEQAHAIQAIDSTPMYDTEWKRLGPVLDGALSDLKDADRDAILRRFFKNQSFGEMGEALRVPENTARMRVDRALEKLNQALRKRGVTSTAGALSLALANQPSIAAPAGLAGQAAAAAIAAKAATIGGGIAAATFLKFMTATKVTLTVATLAAVFGIAAAVHEHRAADLAALGLEEAKQQQVRAHLDAEKAQKETEDLRAALAQAEARSAVPAAKPAPHTPYDSLMEMLSNPGMQAQTSITAKLRLETQFGDLFKSLNLPPDKLEQFKQLLVEKEMVGFDSMTAAHDQGIDVTKNAAGFFQVVGGAEKTVDNQIASLLGAEGYGEFQNYEATIPGRNTTTLLAQSMSYTSTPLTADQKSGLVTILNQYGTPALPPTNPFSVLNGDLGVVSLSEQGLAQAAGILSADQMATLKDKINQQSQLLEARKKMGH